MSQKMIKLQFKKVKSHLNHADDWNHFTEDGQVGEYPEEIGRQKLVDFPNSFTEYKQPEAPKKKAKPQPKKTIEEAPDKSLKESGTKKKETGAEVDRTETDPSQFDKEPEEVPGEQPKKK